MDRTRTYLDDIGKTPLLDADDEMRLARQIEAGLEADRQLASGAVSSGEERARLRAQSRRGRQARDAFVAANLRLVVSIARRFQGRGVDLADLIQEGNIGLMRAVELYDWRRGFRFSTYASWWIRQAVIRAVDDASSPVHVPTRLLADCRLAARARAELEAIHGRPPTTDEVAEAAGLDPEQVEAATACPRHTVSLSTPVRDDDTELGELIADQTTPSPERLTTDQAERDAVRLLVEALPRRSGAVLRLRYGLDGERPLTLEEAATRLGISRERVRQLERRALSRLRPEVPSALDDVQVAV